MHTYNMRNYNTKFICNTGRHYNFVEFEYSLLFELYLQVSPFFFSFIILEVIILHIKGMKKRLPRLNDAISSLSAGVIAQLPL